METSDPPAPRKPQDRDASGIYLYGAREIEKEQQDDAPADASITPPARLRRVGTVALLPILILVEVAWLAALLVVVYWLLTTL